MGELILYVFVPVLAVMLVVINVTVIRYVIALNAGSLSMKKMRHNRLEDQRLFRVNLHALHKRKKAKGNGDHYPGKRRME